MSRNKDYQRLLNSKQWRELRAWKLNKNPLCERCIEEGRAAGLKDGYIRSAVDVHHIIPVESATSLQGMEALAFNPDNLRSLCVPCHVKTHQEMNSKRKENVTTNRARAFTRWVDKIKRMNTSD